MQRDLASLHHKRIIVQQNSCVVKFSSSYHWVVVLEVRVAALVVLAGAAVGEVMVGMKVVGEEAMG